MPPDHAGCAGYGQAAFGAIFGPASHAHITVLWRGRGRAWT